MIVNMVHRLTRTVSRPLALAVAVALLLTGAAVGLFVAQRNARDGLTERFYDRIEPVDQFLDVALLETMRSRAFAAKTFAKVPTAAGAATVNDNINGGTGLFVIFDARGSVAAVSAPTAALQRDAVRLLARPPAARAALRRALRGTPCDAKQCSGAAVSEFVGTPRAGDETVNRPSVGFYVPYEVAGRRYVIADVGSADGFQQILGSLFTGAGVVRGSHAYLVSGDGRVVAEDGNSPAHLGRPAGDRAMVAAVAEGTRGAYTSTTGEPSHFIARRVQGSSMHLALTAPDDRLYASVSGAGRWLPWVLLLALVGAAAVALLALRASNRRGEALAAANAAKTRFLASASHELRTPLNGIIGFSQLLYDGKLGELDEVQREATKDILTSGEHLNRLVGSLLDITRAETGRLEIHPESVDLGELVDDVRAGLQTVAEDKGIVMGARVGDDLPGRVVVDPTRLRQVLLNYLSNALKFTPEGGRVSIEVTLENDAEFRVAVRDTGPGLSEEAIAKLFQRYERLHTTAAEGTGLGLAVTREIVEAHGGRTGVESTLGAGALFYATFPLETVAEQAATPS